MIRKIEDAIRPTKEASLAKSMAKLGWWGFWLQVIVGTLPIILMIYYFAFSQARSDIRQGLRFIEYLVIADLAILLFTALWFFRYTRLAQRIMVPDRRPSESSVFNTLWTGVVASAIGMSFSMILLLIESANMLFYFLKAPQGGMPVIQTSGTEAVHWVSTIDMVSLMAVVCILFCELIVLVFGLWLLFRISFGSAEYPKTIEV